MRERSDLDVALLARSLDIDIAVDLAGFTQGAARESSRRRVAPVQASWLGYLGTMAAEYIDYLIADATIVPDALRGNYAEKIVRLPSYQPNDTKRTVAERSFTRQELGLPPEGFVYCSSTTPTSSRPPHSSAGCESCAGPRAACSSSTPTTTSCQRTCGARRSTRGVDSGAARFRQAPARGGIPCPLPRRGSLPGYAAVQRRRHGERRAVGRPAGADLQPAKRSRAASRRACSTRSACPSSSPNRKRPTRSSRSHWQPRPSGWPRCEPARPRTARRPRCSTSSRHAKSIENAYAEMHRRAQAGLAPDHIDIAP